MIREWQQNARPLDIICLGRVAVDFYSEQIGSSIEESKSFSKYLGGCAGNIAVGCARLGLRSAMLSCVGTDALGQFLKVELQKEKVDIRFLQETKNHLTGLVILGIDPPDRFPLIFYRQNCADMQLKKEHISADYLAQSASLLITGTGLSTESMRATTFVAVEIAKKVGTKIIFDLDYRPVLWGLTELGNGESRYKSSHTVSQHYQSLLPHCNLIVGTQDEIFIAGGADSLHIALNNIRAHSTAPIILKKGEEGCAIFLNDMENPLCADSFPVEVVNVLGAGDAFLSGFMRGLLRGESWQTCATYANANGAIVVTRHGCAPAMPTYQELLSFIVEYNKVKGKPDVRICHS